MPIKSTKTSDIEVYCCDFKKAPVKRQFPLIIADPPYGRISKEKWDVEVYPIPWLQQLERFAFAGTALYWFGGWGKYQDRVLFQTLAQLEHKTNWHLHALIPWVKKRAYGTKYNYLAAMEFIAYMTLGPRPRRFKKPYLDEIRGYAGYDPKYPAHDARKRRTMVWQDIAEVMDVTELLKGKQHPTEKPTKLYDIMIETHTTKGAWVLAPFAGSGTCGVAARALGRKAVLIDSDPESYVLMCDRLEL